VTSPTPIPPVSDQSTTDCACDHRFGAAGRFFRLCSYARYPNHYIWYVLASSIDIMLTYLIVWQLGGREANAIAKKFIDLLDHWGLILLKFSTVLLVIAICEFVGSRNDRVGRRLAIAAICLSALPVGAALLQFLAWTHWDLIEVPQIDTPSR